MLPEDLIGLLSQYGAPLVFVLGLIQGWWYLKPHVQLIEKTLERALAQVQEAKVNEDRAYSIAEESHRLAQMALDQNKRTDTSVKEVHAQIERATQQVHVEIANVGQAVRELQLEIARVEGKKQ